MNNISWRLISAFTALSAVVVFALIQLTPLRLIENSHEDLLVLSAGWQQQPSKQIVVIEVRETTLANFPYRSPLDREFLAKLINKLVDAKARAIGLDIVLDQATEPEKDSELRSAILRGGNIISVPLAKPAINYSEETDSFQRDFLNGVNVASIILAKDAQDGVVRHYLTGEQIEGQWRQALAAKMADRKPVENSGAYERIYFQNGEKSDSPLFPTYPAEAAMHLPGDWFRDKYVLIGKNVASIDQFRTPFAASGGERFGVLPGVQIHAHILNQLISGQRIIETGLTLKIAAMTLAGLIGVLIATIRIEIWQRLFIVSATIVSLLAIGYVALASASLMLPTFAAACSMLASFAMMSSTIWQRDRSQRRFVRKAWSQYVSEPVVDTLISNPTLLTSGGTRTEASYIFTDVEGFTKLSEELSLEMLSEVINDYLDLITEEFKAAGATIDKIVGDAVVGFVGAPVEDQSHADKAISLALELDRKSVAFREKMKCRGVQFGRTRIGVNSGPAVIGNFGGSSFFDYTAIGDNVNVAARLEGANKVTGGTICVSGETAKRAKEHFFRPVGLLYVYGRSNAVEAWEPVSKEEEKSPAFSLYRSAYESLEKGESSARRSFQSLVDKYPNDHLARFHLNRLIDGNTNVEIELGK